MSMFRPVGPEAAHDLTADRAPVSGPRGATRASISGAGCSRPELSAAFLSLRPNCAEGRWQPCSWKPGLRPAAGAGPGAGGWGSRTAGGGSRTDTRVAFATQGAGPACPWTCRVQ